MLYQYALDSGFTWPCRPGSLPTSCRPDSLPTSTVLHNRIDWIEEQYAVHNVKYVRLIQVVDHGRTRSHCVPKRRVILLRPSAVQFFRRSISTKVVTLFFQGANGHQLLVLAVDIAEGQRLQLAVIAKDHSATVPQVAFQVQLPWPATAPKSALALRNPQGMLLAEK